MKQLFSCLLSLCAVSAYLAASRPPDSIFKQQQLLGQVETMPDSDENRGVFGNNNFTYGPVPRKDQWFDVEFLEVSPTPIDM